MVGEAVLLPLKQRTIDDTSYECYCEIGPAQSWFLFFLVKEDCLGTENRTCDARRREWKCPQKGP